MQPNTLTFPAAFPGLAPRSDSRRLHDLLQRLRSRWLLDDPARARAEKRLRRTARRGRRIVLGTAELPYEPLLLDGAPLQALRAFDGLEVAVTTRAPEIVEQLDLLIELDRRHAVSVDLLVACLDPESPDLRERLRAAAALGAEGITTRLVALEPAGLSGGRLGRAGEARLRRLRKPEADLPH